MQNNEIKDSKDTSKDTIESDQQNVCSLEEMEYMTYLKLQCMQP